MSEKKHGIWSTVRPGDWICYCEVVCAYHKADVARCTKCNTERPEKKDVNNSKVG